MRGIVSVRRGVQIRFEEGGLPGEELVKGRETGWVRRSQAVQARLGFGALVLEN